MITSGFLSAEKGTSVPYYKTKSGYQHISKFNNDYDVSHYNKSFLAKTAVFKEAVNDFKALINFEVETKPTSVFIDLSPTTMGVWINLSSNLKHSPKGTGPREKIVMIDDEDAIQSFVDLKNNTDIYRSVYAFYSNERLKKAGASNLGKCKMLGDFWIEFEGDFEKSQIMNAAILALKATIELLKMKFGIENIFIYYNGGKSFYLRISYGYFIEEPEYRLESKYKLFFDYILSLLPPNLAERLDTSLYDITQVLRIPGSIYPGRGYMVEVPNSIDVNNWREVVGSIEPPNEIDPFFVATPQLDQTTISKSIFCKMTKQARFKAYRATVGSHKNKIKLIEDFLKKNPNKVAPCLKNIALAIAKGNPIGFGGRAKLIFEATRLGVSEQDIIKMFLLDPDEYHYGVLSVDHSTETGYRLKQSFCKSMTLDVGCGNSDLASFCNPTNCYRSEMMAKNEQMTFGQYDPTFEDFQTNAQEQLRGFLYVTDH
jgi:hypothetical protein